MFINPDGVAPFCIISVLVYALVGTLCFHLANILFLVALDAKTQVKSVTGFASHLVTYLVFFGPCSVCEVRGRDDVVTAFGVWSAPAWCASALDRLLFSYNLVFANFGLTQNVT